MKQTSIKQTRMLRQTAESKEGDRDKHLVAFVLNVGNCARCAAVLPGFDVVVLQHGHILILDSLLRGCSIRALRRTTKKTRARNHEQSTSNMKQNKQREKRGKGYAWSHVARIVATDVQS